MAFVLKYIRVMKYTVNSALSAMATELCVFRLRLGAPV
jgi:hypothetical protein